MCVFVVYVSVFLLFACLTTAEYKANNWTVKYILNISKPPRWLWLLFILLYLVKGLIFLSLIVDFVFGPGLWVIKLEHILRLKIERNDWLLADTCPQAANDWALF